MDLYPAIDLRGGRCVRLRQGDYDAETVYDAAPATVARGFAEAGAPWIHVVDLDAARTGTPANRELIAEIIAAVDVPVQVGGGVRDQESARTLHELGAARVVMGTVAMEQPELVARVAAVQPVAVGLDVRGTEVAVRGWTEGAGRGLGEALGMYDGVAGVEAVVITQIAVDGTLEGPDLGGLELALSATRIPIVASGGVGGLEDLGALAGLECDGRHLEGVIVGKAVHEGRFTVPAALDALR